MTCDYKIKMKKNQERFTKSLKNSFLKIKNRNLVGTLAVIWRNKHIKFE